MLQIYSKRSKINQCVRAWVMNMYASSTNCMVNRKNTPIAYASHLDPVFDSTFYSLANGRRCHSNLNLPLPNSRVPPNVIQNILHLLQR